MKLSGCIASFLSRQHAKLVFNVYDAAALRLTDSISRATNIYFVCTPHGQSGAMATDPCGCVSHNIGAGAAKSAPGAENMLTDIVRAHDVPRDWFRAPLKR
jgi:thiamine pyrophosphate-dependent acetolactate synthase large subunit-like protein